MEINGVELRAGQYGNQTVFLNGKIQNSQMIQFLGLDSDGDLMFRYDPTGDHRLTVSKNAFPVHIWKSDPDIERECVITMYP